MVSRQIGLTDLYNRHHDASERGTPINELRELHCAIDDAIARLYGWGDIDLGHGFHDVPYLPENDRVRFTISESARVEILRRLAVLNRTRHEAEVREGLHGPADTGVVDLQAELRRRERSGRASVQEAGASYAQGDLALEGPPRKVAEPSPAYESTDGTARQIREWLVAHRGWHTKEEILAGARVDHDGWSTAIKELVESGVVAKQGERRGTKYSARHA
jgi:hypothetical protein